MPKDSQRSNDLINNFNEAITPVWHQTTDQTVYRGEKILKMPKKRMFNVDVATAPEYKKYTDAIDEELHNIFLDLAAKHKDRKVKTSTLMRRLNPYISKRAIALFPYLYVLGCIDKSWTNWSWAKTKGMWRQLKALHLESDWIKWVREDNQRRLKKITGILGIILSCLSKLFYPSSRV